MLSNEKKLDPRVKRTRNLLKQAFIELMQEIGFRSITVQNITERAEINRATFYAHFADKYQLIEQVMIESFEQTLQDYISDTDTLCQDSLKRLIIGVCTFRQLQEDTQCHHPSDQEFRPILESKIQSHLYNIIFDWLNLYEERIENTEITAATVSGAILGASLHWSKQQTIKIETVINQVILLIEGGLSASHISLSTLPELA